MVPVVTCPECGGTELSEAIQETRERVVEDIEIGKPNVRRFEIHRRYCRNCKKLVETPVEDALPGARLGLRTMLAIAWLKVGLRMTEEAIPKVMQSLFGLHVSEGEVVEALARLAEAFGPFYGELEQLVREAGGRGMDETSWRKDGENCWLWVFVTKCVALYKIAAKRDHKVPLAVTGTTRKGVDIHDRFSAYETLESKTKRKQQLCWSHILGDSKELAQFYGREGRKVHRVLKATYRKADAFDHKGTDADVERLFNGMATKLAPPYKSLKCYKFVVNLLKEGKDALFEFVRNPEVDGTNNAAERALRHAVVARKISGGSRSDRGTWFTERLLSVFQTLKLRGQTMMEHGAAILRTSHG